MCTLSVDLPRGPSGKFKGKDKYLDPDFIECQSAAFYLNTLTTLEPPRLLQPDVIERLSQEGCKTWSMGPPLYRGFKGKIASGVDKGGPGWVTKVVTEEDCELSCMWSNLPIMAGSYGIEGKQGVYYEVVIRKMEGMIAIGNPKVCIRRSPLLTWSVVGSACLPYPNWRFPGWHRLSVGLHLDDSKIYFGDPSRNKRCRRNPLSSLKIRPGDTIGFGYKFASNGVFFTHNGRRLRQVRTDVYVPRENHDVYAAIGMLGANDFEVNFGTEAFKWKDGNCWAWKFEGHVGGITGSPGSFKEETPPRYEDVATSSNSGNPPPSIPSYNEALKTSKGQPESVQTTHDHRF